MFNVRLHDLHNIYRQRGLLTYSNVKLGMMKTSCLLLKLLNAPGSEPESLKEFTQPYQVLDLDNTTYVFEVQYRAKFKQIAPTVSR